MLTSFACVVRQSCLMGNFTLELYSLNITTLWRVHTSFFSSHYIIVLWYFSHSFNDISFFRAQFYALIYFFVADFLGIFMQSTSRFYLKELETCLELLHSCHRENCILNLPSSKDMFPCFHVISKFFFLIFYTVWKMKYFVVFFWRQSYQM